MERPDNPVFEINIDNIEDAYNTVKANKNTDEHLVFIKDEYDLTKAMNNNVNSILVTDSVSLYKLYAKRGTAVYNSFVNDTRLKNIRISLYNAENHKNLFELLKEILVVHPNLRSLEIKTAHNGSGFRKTFLKEHCASFCEGLKHARALKELIIYDTGEIDDKMSQMLAAAINENKTLNNIKLSAPAKVVQTLCASLKKNSRIQILQIEGTNFCTSALNISYIKELFEENTTIKTLLFTGITYKNADVDPLMTFLQTTTSLQTLDFPLQNYFPVGSNLNSDIQFREKVFSRFVQSIVNRPGTPLRTLKITQLSVEYLNTLLSALIDNSSLTSLQLGKIDVDDDPMDSEYWSYLSIDENTIQIWNELLTKNKTLKEIALNGLVCQKQDLPRFGAVSVDWFKHNKTLTKLDLRANNLVTTLLGDALSHNKTLKALKCSRHFIPDPLWQMLLTNKTLTEIDISEFFSNGQNDTYMLLQHNTTVQKLSSTLYHYEGDLFLEELANNCSITSYINVPTRYGIPMEFSGKAIASLKKNWILTDLELRNGWYKAFYEPILIRNRLFKLHITLVMYNIARQKLTIFPLEIWRLIFRHLTPDLSILV